MSKPLFQEDDLLMISALQHLLFCPRQCALIHIEQLWLENRLTAEGKIMHERVHKPGSESRSTKRIEYDLPLRSMKLGITGRADVVEFHKIDNSWIPYPVEYKRGKPKRDHSDTVQLCAQAMCIEEMTDVSIQAGALYYGKKHRRTEIIFEDKLRELTSKSITKLHRLIASGTTPKPKYSKKCHNCSFEEICLPSTFVKKRTVKNYLSRMLA